MNNYVFSHGGQAAQRILSGSSTLRSNVVFSYSIGLVSFIAALAVRFELEVAIPNFPYITFIPAVIISAFVYAGQDTKSGTTNTTPPEGTERSSSTFQRRDCSLPELFFVSSSIEDDSIIYDGFPGIRNTHRCFH